MPIQPLSSLVPTMWPSKPEVITSSIQHSLPVPSRQRHLPPHPTTPSTCCRMPGSLPSALAAAACGMPDPVAYSSYTEYAAALTVWALRAKALYAHHDPSAQHLPHVLVTASPTAERPDPIGMASDLARLRTLPPKPLPSRFNSYESYVAALRQWADATADAAPAAASYTAAAFDRSSAQDLGLVPQSRKRPALENVRVSAAVPGSLRGSARRSTRARPRRRRASVRARTRSSCGPSTSTR